MENKKIKILTFGCRLNAYESEVLRQNAQEAGWEDVVIVNSCAVTGEAERQVKQAIRRSRRENPNWKIVVTGCAAQRSPEVYAAMPEVDYVTGNADKTAPNLFAKLETSPLHLEPFESAPSFPPLQEGYEGKPRGFVQIQTGCNHACTFCIVAQTRGPSRSVSLKEIEAQIEALASKGYREYALTGVDIASWGLDLEGTPDLTFLIRHLLKECPRIERLRLSSLDPAALDEAFLDLLGSEPRLAPHLHLSLQAGDDLILKRMRRRHSAAQIETFVQKARQARPDVTFGADLIAGFPTETEAMFEATRSLVKRCGFLWLHVFPYSARSGTPAAKMPQVPADLRRRRAELLRAEGTAAIARYLESLSGKRVRVMVEREGLGREPGFAEVLLPPGPEVGSLTEVILSQKANGTLEGVPL